MEPKTKREKQIAKAAFDAGISAQKFNHKRDRLLDEGIKNCPCEETFETYLDRFDMVKEKTK